MLYSNKKEFSGQISVGNTCISSSRGAITHINIVEATAGRNLLHFGPLVSSLFSLRIFFYKTVLPANLLRTWMSMGHTLGELDWIPVPLFPYGEAECQSSEFICNNHRNQGDRASDKTPNFGHLVQSSFFFMLSHLMDFFTFKSPGIFAKATAAKRQATKGKAHFVKYPTNVEGSFYSWIPATSLIIKDK